MSASGSPDTTVTTTPSAQSCFRLLRELPRIPLTICLIKPRTLSSYRAIIPGNQGLRIHAVLSRSPSKPHRQRHSPFEDFIAAGPQEILVHESDLEAARELRAHSTT
jgi:hypothetical protein